MKYCEEYFGKTQNNINLGIGKRNFGRNKENNIVVYIRGHYREK